MLLTQVLHELEGCRHIVSSSPSEGAGRLPITANQILVVSVRISMFTACHSTLTFAMIL